MTEDQESQLDQMQTAEDGIPSSTTQDTDDIPLAMVEDESDMNFRDSKERPVYKLSVKLIDTYKHINKVRNYIIDTFLTVFLVIVGCLFVFVVDVVTHCM